MPSTAHARGEAPIGSGQEPGRPVLGRGAVALAVGLPISAALLAEAVRGTNLDDVSASLQAASPMGLLAAVLAIGAVYLLQAARWRFIARQYGDLPRRPSPM